jgi:nucleotide-binding universal stress UspA family protein
MKRILVPVDFSAHTDISCQYALQMAFITGAEIILFHSFSDQFYYSDGGLSTGFESGLMMNDEIIMDLYNQKKTRLDRIAKELTGRILKNDMPGIEISCRMDSGDPELQILQVTKEINPDLIVMGSGGIGKKGLLAGSVARSIIDHTEIPVIAVPDVKKIPVLKNIAYMTTFDLADLNVIPGIDALLSSFTVNIYCLHLTKNNLLSENTEKMKVHSEKLAPINHDGRISFHVLAIDHEEEILQNFLADNQIGLICFIPHKRHMFEDLFYQGIKKEDLFETRIPILAVRPSL